MLCDKEWLGDVKSLFNCSVKDLSRMRQLYADMMSKLIGHRDSDAQLYGSVPCEPGPFMRKFRQKFTKQLQQLCGVDGEVLVKLCKVKRFHSVHKLYKFIKLQPLFLILPFLLRQWL